MLWPIGLICCIVEPIWYRYDHNVRLHADPQGLLPTTSSLYLVHYVATSDRYRDVCTLIIHRMANGRLTSDSVTIDR